MARRRARDFFRRARRRHRHQEKRVDALSNPSVAMVVTDDIAIQRWVKSAKAKVLSCKEFLALARAEQPDVACPALDLETRANQRNSEKNLERFVILNKVKDLLPLNKRESPERPSGLRMTQEKNMFDKMKQLYDMQKQARQMKQDLEAQIVEKTALGGKLKVAMNGTFEVQSIHIDDSLLNPLQKTALETGLAN